MISVIMPCHNAYALPRIGDMPQDRILDGAEIIVSKKDRTYKVMLANCIKARETFPYPGR